MDKSGAYVGWQTRGYPAPLHGLRILVVEDEVLIALTAQDMLLEAGAAEVAIATRFEEACERLAGDLDAAIIDLNLGNGFDASIAMLTHGRRIPFVVASGYGRTLELPAALANVPIITKPFASDDLVLALLQAIARSTEASD